MKKYSEIRQKMESGDVLFFKPRRFLGWGKVIQWWTGSALVHCGLVIRFGGRIFLLEASETGFVRLYPLRKIERSFLWVSLKMSNNGIWNDKLEEVAMDRVGSRYDYLGAFLAGLKKQRKNGRYYCSELVLDVLQAASFIENRNSFYTPADVHSYLTKNLQAPSSWVNLKIN